MIKILFLLTFIPFFGYAAKNSTNQSKITNSTSINDESNQINEISYGIFTFLFAIFAIFLLLGIFCLVEQYLCKNSGKLKLLLKKILRNLRLYKINQRIRQKANRKKRLASPRNSLFKISMGKPLVYEITRGIVMQPEIINIAIKERTDFIDKKKNSIK